MKKTFILASALLLLSSACVAQTTAVTATVTDSDSQAWANGTWVLSFQPGPYDSNPAHYTIGGSPLSTATAYQNGTMDGNGNISLTAYRNTAISPIGSSFNLQVCPNASTPCATINFSTSGSSQSLSTVINGAILAPRFAPVSGSYGYADGEAILQLKPGSTYWNVTSSAQRCYTGSAWGACSQALTTLISTSGPVTVIGSGFYYNNSTGALTYNLPTITSALVGSQFCFRNYTTRTGVITLKSPTSTFIDAGGTAGSSSGTYVSGGAAGDSACVVAGDTTHYFAYSGSGTWTNN